jgi:hypothetical protein
VVLVEIVCYTTGVREVTGHVDYSSVRGMGHFGLVFGWMRRGGRI